MISANVRTPDPRRKTKVAYGFQLHMDPQQFRWVFDALYDTQEVFSVHIDRKTSQAVFEQFQAIIGEPGNLVYLDRSDVYWGGWTGLFNALD